jgi:hypothetical protein
MRKPAGAKPARSAGCRTESGNQLPPASFKSPRREPQSSSRQSRRSKGSTAHSTFCRSHFRVRRRGRRGNAWHSHGRPVQRIRLCFLEGTAPQNRHACACHAAVRFGFRHSASESFLALILSIVVMAVLVTAIHVFLAVEENVNARDKHAHDDSEGCLLRRSTTDFAEPDSRVLVTRIHVFFAGRQTRGWPEQVRP